VFLKQGDTDMTQDQIIAIAVLSYAVAPAALMWMVIEIREARERADYRAAQRRVAKRLRETVKGL
jgi:hypothetical protein